MGRTSLETGYEGPDMRENVEMDSSLPYLPRLELPGLEKIKEIHGGIHRNVDGGAPGQKSLLALSLGLSPVEAGNPRRLPKSETRGQLCPFSRG